MNTFVHWQVAAFVETLRLTFSTLDAAERRLGMLKENHPEYVQLWVAHDWAGKIAGAIKDGVKQIGIAEQRESREIANAERAA